MGATIDRNVRQAAYLAELVDAAEHLERLAPVTLQIVVFRYVPPGVATSGELAPAAKKAKVADAGTAEVAVALAKRIDDLNDTIVTELQERGIAVPSTTRIGGQLAIRPARITRPE